MPNDVWYDLPTLYDLVKEAEGRGDIETNLAQDILDTVGLDLTTTKHVRLEFTVRFDIDMPMSRPDTDREAPHAERLAETKHLLSMGVRENFDMVHTKFVSWEPSSGAQGWP